MTGVAPMHTMFFRGHRLRFIERGKGEPVVFVHNGAVGHRLWDHQLAHFEPSHRVIAPDLLGHGESDRPAIVYTAEDFVDQVDQLTDHLELEQFHLVGCCLGGGIALEIARRRPKRVKTLSVITAATPKVNASGPFGPFERFTKPGSRARDLLASACDSRLGRLGMTWAFRRWQCGECVLQDSSFQDHVGELYAREGEWRVFCNYDLGGFAHLDAFSKPDGFPPTLLMWGEQNPILKASAGRELAAVLKPERIEFWDDGGYMLMREYPDRTNAVLAEHFSGSAAPRQAQPETPAAAGIRL